MRASCATAVRAGMRCREPVCALSCFVLAALCSLLCARCFVLAAFTAKMFGRALTLCYPCMLALRAVLGATVVPWLYHALCVRWVNCEWHRALASLEKKLFDMAHEFRVQCFYSLVPR